jgi:hypothetical protein
MSFRTPGKAIARGKRALAATLAIRAARRNLAARRRLGHKGYGMMAMLAGKLSLGSLNVLKV